jgi:hypothetical protein
VGGNLYAFEAATGELYWKAATGSAIVAPLSVYRTNGHEYLTVVVGEAGGQQTPNLPESHGSHVMAYRLGSEPTVENDASGQVALAQTNETPEPMTQSVGSAPYTKQQVARGGEVYATRCAACHGSELQGRSAPALTGQGFGHFKLTAAQLRTLVVQTMPLGAPGTLPAYDYAALMAFMLSYDCVPSSGAQQPFPTTPVPALEHVQVGSGTCVPKP